MNVSLNDPTLTNREALLRQGIELAMEQFSVASEYSFLVGEDYEGWTRLGTDYKGYIRIRLPDWHEGIVADTLSAYGMVLGCPHNNYWVFPLDSGVTIEQARALLAPLLKKGTRFTDEAELARKLDEAVENMGNLHRCPIFEGQRQASLF